MSAVAPARADWVFEPCPCECCPHALRCAAKTQACAAFESFVLYGGRRWRGIEARSPSAAMYARIFQGAVTSLA